jgi:hypothetical protein
LDSIPADIVAYLSSKTLRDTAGQPVGIDTSLSAYSMRGGMSGGTIGTGITTLEKVPQEELRVSQRDYTISPCKSFLCRRDAGHTNVCELAIGAPLPRRPLVYRLFLPDTRKTLTGCLYFMARTDRALVQRTWGLLQAEAAEDKTHLHYGPAFKYDEFLVTGGAIRAMLLTLGMAIGAGFMMITPVREPRAGGLQH